MANLYFDASADYDAVVKLRSEIAKLEAQLKKLDANKSPEMVRDLEMQLSSAKQQMNGLTTVAAQTAAVLESEFRQSIVDAASESALSLEELRKEYEKYRGEVKSTIASNLDLGNSLGIIEKLLGKSNKSSWVKEIFTESIRVREQFRLIEQSMQTLLGSEQKVESLMSNVKEYTKTSPFELKDIHSATENMLSGSVNPDEIVTYLNAIGDVAMGQSEKFRTLTQAFSEVSSVGILTEQTLNQMINSGFNPLTVIAQETGTTIEQLKNQMYEGAISADTIQQAFINASSAGGEFHNKAAESMGTLPAQLAVLNNALDTIFNSVGKQTEGLAAAVVQPIASMAQALASLEGVIPGLVAAYGAYHVAVLIVTAAERLKNLATLAQIAGMTTMQAIMDVLRAKMALLNKTMLANPFVLVTTLVVGAVAAMWSLSDGTTAAEKATRRFNKEQENYKKIQEERQQTIEGLIRIIQDETETEFAKIDAYEKLKTLSPALVAAYSREKLETLELTEVNKKLNKIRDEDNYNNTLSNIDRLTKSIKQLKEEHGKYVGTAANGQPIIRDNSFAIRKEEENLGNYRKLLFEYDRLQKEAIERAKPIETRIENAKADLAQIGAEFKKVEAKIAEEKKKLETNSFYTIPIELSFELYAKDRAVQEKQSQVNSLLKEQAGQTTYKEDLAKAEKEWKEAKQRYDTILKNKKATTAARTDALDELNEKKSAYDKLSGLTYTPLSNKDDEAKRLIDQQIRYQDLHEKQTIERKRSLEEMALGLRQIELDLEDENSEKKLKQMRLNHDIELQELKREKEDFLSNRISEERALFEADPKNKEQRFDASKVSLSEDENNYFNNKQNLTEKKQKKEEKTYLENEEDRNVQAMNQYLSEYGTYLEKRNAIIEQYNKKISEADTEGEALSLKEKMKEVLSELDMEANKEVSAIGRLFSNMSGQTVKGLREIADEAEAAFEFLKNGEWNEKEGELFKISKETFEVLQKSPEKLESIGGEIENIRSQADQLESCFGRAANGLKKIFSAGNDSNKLKEGLAELSNGLNEMQAIAGFVSDTFSTLGDALGSDGMKDASDGINTAMDALGGAMSGAQAGAAFGPWGAAAGAAIGLASSLTSSFAKMHDKKHEKQIQKMQEQIELLDETYQSLARSIEKAYSSDASKLIEDQNKALEQQKVLIKQQIAEEKKKKKTDNNRIKEWEEQLKQIDLTIEDNREKAVDAIFGGDVKSAIDNFAQAYADAWAAGNDKAKTSKDIVKDMIKGMVMEALKADISAPMEQIRSKLVEFWADGVISANEQSIIDQMSQNLMDKLDREYAWADDYLKGDQEDSSQDSTKRGFETMSQDTASELEGRFTALQQAGEELKAQSLIQSESLAGIRFGIDLSGITLLNMHNIADETRTILANSYIELEGIRENTGMIVKPIKEMNERLDQIEKNTRAL